MGTKGLDLVGKILLSWNNTSYFMIFLIFCYPFVSSCFSLSGSAKCYWLSMAFLELNLGRAWDGWFSHGELTTSISDIYQAIDLFRNVHHLSESTYLFIYLCLSLPIQLSIYIFNGILKGGTRHLGQKPRFRKDTGGPRHCYGVSLLGGHQCV